MSDSVVLWRLHSALNKQQTCTLVTKVAQPRIKPGNTVVILACGTRARKQNLGIEAVCIVLATCKRGRRVKVRVVQRMQTARAWFERLKHYQAPHVLRQDERDHIARHPAITNVTLALRFPGSVTRACNAGAGSNVAAAAA